MSLTATLNWADDSRAQPTLTTLVALTMLRVRMRAKVLISWNSGKESAWMLHRLRQSGEYEIGALLTTVNEVAHRVAMHAVRVQLLEAQSGSGTVMDSPDSAELPQRDIRAAAR